MSLFAKVPIEVIQDRRLTLEQMRVLIALLSFRNRDGDTVWPSRASIAEITGMHQSNISTATSALVNLGWLEKDGKGGYSKSTRYTIKASVTVAEQATVAESATVAEQATPTVAEQATRRVAESATRKEQTNEQTKEQTKGVRPSRKCPTDFELAPAMREWAAANAPLVNIESETEAFRDHEYAKPRTDWVSAWRNWIRREQKWATEKKMPSGRRMPQPENFAGKEYGETGLL